MSRTTIDRLIINSPYEEPRQHWRYERGTRTFDLAKGRRPAGYVVASGDSKAFDDPGIFVNGERCKVFRFCKRSLDPEWRGSDQADYQGLKRILSKCPLIFGLCRAF